MIAVTILAVFVAGLLLGFFFGAAVFTKVKTEEIIRKTGFSPKTMRDQMQLLRESMNLINQFLHPTDFIGDMDYLSEPSRKKAEKLLEEYNKEVK